MSDFKSTSLSDDDETATITSNGRRTLKRLDSAGSGSEKSKVSAVNASIIRATSSRQRIEEEASAQTLGVWFPWYKEYKLWWGFTVLLTFFSTFYETYQAAFGEGGQVTGPAAIIGFLLVATFVVDMGVNFNLAYYDEADEIVWDRRLIARNYLSGMFWVDFLGCFPFYAVVLAITGNVGVDDSFTQYWGLLRVLRLVRLHRLKQLYDIVQYSTKISFMTLTLSRDFAVILVWTHLHACIFYFIARQHEFDPDTTWIGGLVAELPTALERYVVSLYWSITTFTTVGYGDYSPVNEIEQIFGMLYMLLNIILQAWVIGSITLLIVKQDEATGDYRDALERLDAYAKAHDLDHHFYRRLKTQVKLDFNNREISDEAVLQDFPVSVRRKVLQKLYLPSMLQTNLLQGVRQQFVDSFLAASHVEIFSPGEDILARGTIAADLYLLVGGIVKLTTRDKVVKETTVYSTDEWESAVSESVSGSIHTLGKHIQAGEFINPISFFTESPQLATVRTLTVCKTLTLPRTAYKCLVEDYPQAAQHVVQNLLRKVEELYEASKSGGTCTADTDNTTETDGASKAVRFEGYEGNHESEDEGVKTQREFQLQAAQTTLQDLVHSHANKLRDDRTTRFLFAASRGDIRTLNVLLNQSLDPDVSDYDHRTALMVASMAGQTAVVTKLLELNANPNLKDVHGTTALSEAAMNGHSDVMHVLMKHGGSLCLSESKAASVLCQAVFDGDVVCLQRLLEAKIDVNSGDYDRRTAVHIAASEGNLAALKVLVKYGADLDVKDRWDNSVKDEARRARAGHVVDYLDSLLPKQESS